jgi:hypothetical protein
MNPAVIVLVGFVAAALAAVLMWRWMQVAERIGIEKAKAGGDERAKAIEQLTTRVGDIERYMSGEDIKRP